MSIGFDPSHDRRQRELPKNKNVKSKYHVRSWLKDLFGFAQHHLKSTYGFGYVLTLTRSNDSAVLKKEDAINNAKIKIKSNHCYVPHYTPSIAQQAILFNQIQSKTPTELQCPEGSIYMKEVNTQSFWKFESGTREGLNVPICIFVCFQQVDRQNSQNARNDTFHRLPVTSAHVINGKERYPDNRLFLNDDDDKYFQGYEKIKEAFKASTQDDIWQSYVSKHDHRSSNDGDNIGYVLYSFGHTMSEISKVVNQQKENSIFLKTFPLGYMVMLQFWHID